MSDKSLTVTPMNLLQSARETGATIDQMQQLMELQFRWEENEARKAFNTAIADFKAEGVRILKDKKVAYSSTRYTHATLGNVVETVTPVMSKHGLSHTWDVKQVEGAITVICKVSHVQGHSITVSMCAEADNSGQKNKIQQIGSTVTYLQRYTLLSALGLATYDQDDDGKKSATPQEATISEEQLINIQSLIAETGTNEAKFCTFMKVAELDEIPAKQYNAAIKALEAKRGA